MQFDSVVEEGEGVIKRVIGLQGDYVMRDTPGTTDSMFQVRKGLLGLKSLVDVLLGTRGPLLGHW